MLKIIRVLFIVLIGCCFICGCATTLTQVGKEDKEPSMKINLPDRYFHDENTVPNDIKMICAAIINKSRHRGETPFVCFDPNGTHKIQEEGFNYEGFDVILTDITGFEAKKTATNTVHGTLEGVLHFQDFVGRRASTYFAATYNKTPQGISITKSGAVGIPPVFPRLEAYFVPAEAINKCAKEDLRGFWNTYLFALENAIDMRPTDEDRQAHQAFEEMSFFKKAKASMKIEKSEFVLMIFCLDRISGDADLELIISETEHSADKSLVEPGYIDEHGWWITMATGKFAADSWWNTNFYAHVFYNPDPEDESKRLLVGLFSNQKDYSPKENLPAGQMQEQKTTSDEDSKSIAKEDAPSTQTQEGPIGSGKVFLNPLLKEDAKQIQARLGELGYYDMKIDGMFGEKSRSALKKFREDNGLGDKALWDIETQKALFSGSGL